MKVQIFYTFECSVQKSPNSCHFWNNRSVFCQSLHQSSGKWDITPLYFYSKFFYIFSTKGLYQSTNLVKFYVSNQKSEILHFNGLLLSKSCTVSTKKVEKSYLSWHWRVIQTFNKNSFFVWKMTWEIWWILTRAVENLKICTLMGYFCQKYVMFELK